MKPTKEQIMENARDMGYNDFAEWILSQLPEEPKEIEFDAWWCATHYAPVIANFELIEMAKKAWTAAQSAMLASGQYIKIPDESEWPDWATEIAIAYCGRNSFNQAFTSRRCMPSAPENNFNSIKRIPRQTPQWSPTAGKLVWEICEYQNTLILWSDKHVMEPGVSYAAYEAVDEITWTREQLRERGKVWESGK